jgi:hypothetical protein
MTYQNTPRSVIAGMGLTQVPISNGDAGVQSVILTSDIATTTSPGIVQVGSGLSITPTGILSAIGSSSDLISVKLTSVDYTALATDYYIGATKKGIEITLPLGIVGKVYVVKNQANGSIEVKGSGGQKLDTSSDKNLGSESSIIVVFDGTRWNIVN